MTAAYFDSSALVTLVIEEDGSEDAARLWDGADTVVTSRIAHPEVRAALAAARRGGRIGVEELAAAKAIWDELRSSMRLAEVTPAVEHAAAELAEEHGLSGFDAVHLASALAVAELNVVVASCDTRLLRAARAQGLPTLPRSPAR